MSYRKSWTDDHGGDGLRPKFRVYKPRDGVRLAQATAVPNESHIGEDGEFIFVLRPESDLAAWLALRVYAREVRLRSPQLADDIDGQLDRILAAQS